MALIVSVLSFGGGFGAIAVVIDPGTANAQITPLDEEPDELPTLGNITGSPEPGPDPEDAGDRGGLAQLTLAVVLGGAVVFISSRLIRAARANQA